MARKKKINQVIDEYQPPKFYAYYDKKTSTILCVSNEKNNSYENGIEISYDIFEKLVSGKEKFTDYKVDIITNDEGSYLGLIPLYEQGYSFKNNLLKWIIQEPTDDTDVIVEWDRIIKHWIFYTNKSGSQRISSGVVPSKLEFYVLLESDFDFIIRTIVIDTKELLGKLYIPFESSFENDINKISIATKIVFNSYGLIIKDE